MLRGFVPSMCHYLGESLDEGSPPRSEPMHSTGALAVQQHDEIRLLSA